MKKISKQSGDKDCHNNYSYNIITGFPQKQTSKQKTYGLPNTSLLLKTISACK